LSGPVIVAEESARIQLGAAAQLSMTGEFNASVAEEPVQFSLPAGSQISLANGLEAAAGVHVLGGGSVFIGGDIDLGGTTIVEAGKLTLSGPSQLASEFNVDAGGTLAVTGGHTFASAAALSGN